MCNLYSMTKNQAAIRQLFAVTNDIAGNLPSMPGIFPDYSAPIVRNADGGRELAMARWGMPSSSKALMDATVKRAAKLEAKGKQFDFKELLRMEPDSGTTNIRNTPSKHWKRWLGAVHRACRIATGADAALFLWAIHQIPERLSRAGNRLGRIVDEA